METQQMNYREEVRKIGNDFGDETTRLEDRIMALLESAIKDTNTHTSTHEYQAPEVIVEEILKPPDVKYKLVNRNGVVVHEGQMRPPMPRVLNYGHLTFLGRAGDPLTYKEVDAVTVAQS